MKSKISIITPWAMTLCAFTLLTACSSSAVPGVPIPDLGPLSEAFRYVGTCFVLCAVVVGLCFILRP